MKVISCFELQEYNQLLKNIGEEYLVVNLKTGRITGKFKVLSPPKEYKQPEGATFIYNG